MSTTRTHYTPIAKALHWTMAVLMFGLLALGFYMADLPLSPDKLKLYAWHKWAGVTAFLLALARVVWRVFNPPPEMPADTPPVARLAASVTHGLLYLLMLAIPLTGWLMSSAKGFQTVWFGVLPIPDLLSRDRALGDTLAQVHVLLNLSLVALLTVHVAAALKHRFIDRDGVMGRMLPAPKRWKEA